MHLTVTAVIVTYGERWDCLTKLLANLCSNPTISDVLVVDNNSKYDLVGNCSEQNYSKVKVIRLPSNAGSAGGFAAGIKAACGVASDYIMLFDDDTLPIGDAIDIMLARLIDINSSTGTMVNAVIPNRDSQLVFLRNKIARKGRWLDNESIVGLNIFTFMQRHLAAGNHADTVTVESNTAEYGLAAYGGLLFHKNMCDVIGYPDSEYILYYDDIDYTNRILINNGRVWICADAFMADIVENYSCNMMNRPFVGFIMADNDSKVYYQLRNQIYFEFRFMSRKKVAFLINAVVFSLLAAIISVTLLRFNRLKVIVTAIRHGLTGKRGAHPLYPLV